MSRIFLGHSSKNNDSAIALRNWLFAHGWDDVFLDLDPTRGIAAGDRWERSLSQAALRCEAVLFLVSRAWLTSDWCLKEFHLAHRLNKRLFGLLIEEIPVADLPITLTGTWQLVQLATGRDHVMLRSILPGTQDETYVTFSQEGLTRLRIGLERAGLDARFFGWPPEDDPKRTPYRGLLPLEAADAGIFFGREAPTVEAIDRIRGMKDGASPRLLVLLGASGAGKSSFLRAGLLPRLARDDRNYLVLPVIRPEKDAINGDTGLVRSLQAVIGAQGMTMARADIRSAIEGGAGTLRPLLQTLIARSAGALVAADVDAKAPLLVLTIDQGEELFRPDGAAESTALLRLLRELLVEDAPALLVAVAIRSDAYEQFQTTKALEGIIQQTLSLTPMPRGAYQAVIEGPSVRLKDSDRPFDIEPALTQALLSDIEDGGGRDALPLLAFTLERIYLEYGDRGRLALADYDTLGRIKGSIEAAIGRAFRAADADARIPQEHEARLSLLRSGLIPWLAGIDPDSGSPRRQRARISEIPEEARPLIDLLVEQRLLSTDIADATGERTIEPSHESLLRQWGSLQGWLKEDFAVLSTLQTVKRSSRDWDANAKGDDWLAHRAGRLEDAERLLLRSDIAGKLDTTDRAYLATCRRREENERQERTAMLERELALQQRAQLRARRFSMAAVVVAIVMAGVGFFAYQQKNVADAATASAERNLKVSEANLKQARINQSHFLSRASALALGNNDPVTAIGLALEALPGGNRDDVPYVTDAEQALFAGLLELREMYVFEGHYNQALQNSFDKKSSRVVVSSFNNLAKVVDSATGDQLAILKGHTDFVKSAAFSPDGSHIVTASHDGTARIWDAESGQQLFVLRGHEDKLYSAVYSADGSLIVTTSDDTTARVWNSATGEQLAALKGHRRGVNWAAFSPEGSRVVTSSWDNSARVWDIASGRQLAIVQMDWRIYGAIFSPDGAQILSWSQNNTARIWDAATGYASAIVGHDEGVSSAAFNHDGSLIVTSSWDKTARVWDKAGHQIAILKGHDGSVNSAEFSLDGSKIITASDDKTVRIWDASTGEQLELLRGHTKKVYSAEFTPDGSRIVTTSEDDTVRVWDAAKGQQVRQLQGHRDKVTRAIFSTDGTRVVTASDDHTARIWDAATGGELLNLHEQGKVGVVAFSPDGSRVVTGYEGAQVWNAITGEPLARLIGHRFGLNSAAFSPDGSRIVTSSYDHTARIWNAATGEQVLLISAHNDSVFNAAFSSDGSRVVTASWDKTARVWNASTGQELALLRGHEVGLNSAYFSPGGTHIVTASNDGTARIWNAASGQQIAVLKHDERVMSAAFSPDSRRVVTASYDRTARIWDASTGQQLLIMRGHEAELINAAFSPDGSRVATSSHDGTARVWNAKTGEPLAILNGHGGAVTSASFSSDGARVVTASEDKTARIWAVARDMKELIETARLRVPRCLSMQQRETYFLPADTPDWCQKLTK
jgi:WD40 repeat protein